MAAKNFKVNVSSKDGEKRSVFSGGILFKKGIAGIIKQKESDKHESSKGERQREPQKEVKDTEVSKQGFDQNEHFIQESSHGHKEDQRFQREVSRRENGPQQSCRDQIHRNQPRSTFNRNDQSERTYGNSSQRRSNSCEGKDFGEHSVHSSYPKNTNETRFIPSEVPWEDIEEAQDSHQTNIKQKEVPDYDDRNREQSMSVEEPVFHHTTDKREGPQQSSRGQIHRNQPRSAVSRNYQPERRVYGNFSLRRSNSCEEKGFGEHSVHSSYPKNTNETRFIPSEVPWEDIEEAQDSHQTNIKQKEVPDYDDRNRERSMSVEEPVFHHTTDKREGPQRSSRDQIHRNQPRSAVSRNCQSERRAYGNSSPRKSNSYEEKDFGEHSVHSSYPKNTNETRFIPSEVPWEDIEDLPSCRESQTSETFSIRNQEAPTSVEKDKNTSIKSLSHHATAGALKPLEDFASIRFSENCPDGVLESFQKVEIPPPIPSTNSSRVLVNGSRHYAQESEMKVCLEGESSGIGLFERCTNYSVSHVSTVCDTAASNDVLSDGWNLLQHREESSQGYGNRCDINMAISPPLPASCISPPREKREEAIQSSSTVSKTNNIRSSSHFPSSCSDSGISSLGEDCEQDLENENIPGKVESLREPQNFQEDHVQAITKLLYSIVEERAGTEVDPQFIAEELNVVVEKHFQGCKLKVYGSYFAGYALGTSDINLELFNNTSYVPDRFFKEIGKYIEKETDYYVSCEEQPTATTRKVVCIEPHYGTECKICHLGPKSPYFKTSKLIKKIFEVDPRVKLLTISLRHWAEVCDLHDSDKGNLHPLVLVLMVIYFLQQHQPPVLPIINIRIHMEDHKIPEANHQELGLLWICLLWFYAKVFNWREHVISITSKEPVLKKDKSWGKYWIAAEAPFNPEKNIASSVRSQDVSQRIQMSFVQSYKYFSSTAASAVPDVSGYSSNGCSLSYNYSFNPQNLTEKVDIPKFCIACEELGSMCEECEEEEATFLQPLPKPSGKHLKHIDDALMDAYNEYALTEEEVEQRKLFVKDLEYYIVRRFKGAELELIGSSTSGFGVRNSDLDICMTFPKRPYMSYANDRKIIKDLCYHLRKNEEFKNVFALYSAKIPIVQFLHPKSGWRGDISFYNTLASHNTKLLYMYSKIDERAKILGCCLKVLAKKACIADTAQKSLSSYSYVLMAIHFLQRTSPAILPALQAMTNEVHMVENCNVAYFNNLDKLKQLWDPGENTASIGELWLDMLKYYVMDIDVNHVISIRDCKAIPKMPGFKRARMFNIEDPFLCFKNLGSVMSEQMSVKTRQTLIRARKLFSTPLDECPSGYASFKDYFFDSMCLTDGAVTNSAECILCGKYGHNKEKCPRFNVNRRRGFSTFRGRFNRRFISGSFRYGAVARETSVHAYSHR